MSNASNIYAQSTHSSDDKINKSMVESPGLPLGVGGGQHTVTGAKGTQHIVISTALFYLV